MTTTEYFESINNQLKEFAEKISAQQTLIDQQANIISSIQSTKPTETTPEPEPENDEKVEVTEDEAKELEKLLADL